MSKKLPSSKSGIGFLEIGFVAAGVAAVWYYLLKDGSNKDGRDLWPALGFPYGPIGNLAAIGSDFKTGNNRPLGNNALPVTMNLGVLVQHTLTDTTTAVLTDAPGIGLTDVFAPPAAQLFTARNAAGINDKFNHGGSTPP